MGIKGIYRELGEGKRVALSKLASDSFDKHDRPYRLAIDIAIWQFQTQAARGGTNPAIRTLFYRLTRLLATPIEPIFVFDGPNKPKFKRNKRSGRGDGVANAQAKTLIRLFGFTVHHAPGEAEAECALLQRHGIVDAVLSEDVDTIMFGCTRTLRDWRAEGKGSKVPTHVSLYDVNEMDLAKKGLDREGMVLVALMSGGDYLPEGVPGCGVKVACEAAKGGFGKSMCRLRASDIVGVQAWRESLIHELRTNESGLFRTRHPSLNIPEDFPNLEILRYYTHPVVSDVAKLDGVREAFHEKRDVELEALREFTRATFDWDFRIGAIKFIRVLGQALLVNSILNQEEEEGTQVKRILSRRTHFSTDAAPELRLAYVPEDVVPIDLSKEVDEQVSSSRTGLALNSDDEFEEAETNGGSKTAPTRIYDPSKPNLAWVLEAVARKSVPNAVEEWEKAKASKAVKKSTVQRKKATGTKAKKSAGMPTGALHQYIRVAKSAAPATSDPLRIPDKCSKPKPPSPKATSPRRLRVPAPLEPSKLPTPSASNSPVRQHNPWSLASSQVTPRSTRPQGEAIDQAILIESSPASPPDSPPSPPSPSPRPRRTAFGSQESVGSFFAKDIGSKGVNKETTRLNRTRRQGSSFGPPGSSQETRLKQTSLDMFATRLSKPSAERAPASIQPPSSAHPPSPPRPKKVPNPPSTTPPKPKHKRRSSDFTSAFTSDDDIFSPLPAPSSPPKQRSSPSPITRSPSPTGRKKKLLVPRASAVGFFREVEVDEDERDARAAKETARLRARGCRAGVVRLSDVAFVDLTGDD